MRLTRPAPRSARPAYLSSSALAALASLAILLAAGCATPPAADTPDPGTDVGLPVYQPLPDAQIPLFAPPMLIDDVRAGGEPVIAVTHKGTILVSSHPGYTHYHPSADPTHLPVEAIGPSMGESYLWRSTDNGTTWTHIGLPGSEEGPRSTGGGVSDPEFTVMPDGTICYTDLEALAAASVSCSTDDGLTWLGNPIASGAPVDRQWLASHGNELYFTANYFTDHHVRASTDRGLTWEDRGDIPCGGDIVADPASGTLYAGCGNGVAVSTDKGVTWSEPRVLEGTDGAGTVLGGIMEPAVDSAGNVWVAWSEGEHGLRAAGSPDQGESWPWSLDLTPHFRAWAAANPEANATSKTANGTFVWPWISAGSEGRFAVTWFGAYPAASSVSYQGNWYVFTAFVLDATTPTPSVAVVQLTPEAMHTGPICQSGTLCQVGSMMGEPASDRRLGDFFETTVEPGTGYLLGVWSNTNERPGDVVSHPQFVRQVGGVRLIADAELATFRPTQG